MWAVVYENGMSLTIASEQTAHSLAQAERDRGRRATVRRLDDVVTHPSSARPEPISVPEPASAPEPAREPEPASVPEPAQAVEPALAVEPVPAIPPVPTAEPASVPEPASEVSPAEPTHEPKPDRTPTPARRRRLPLYALAAAFIVAAAALAAHWGVLPTLGASTSSSPTHVSRPSRPPRLLAPLGQPPVMHFGSALDQSDRLDLPNAHGPRRLRASAGRPAVIARGGSR